MMMMMMMSAALKKGRSSQTVLDTSAAPFFPLDWAWAIPLATSSRRPCLESASQQSLRSSQSSNGNVSSTTIHEYRELNTFFALIYARYFTIASDGWRQIVRAKAMMAVKTIANSFLTVQSAGSRQRLSDPDISKSKSELHQGASCRESTADLSLR